MRSNLSDAASCRRILVAAKTILCAVFAVVLLAGGAALAWAEDDLGPVYDKPMESASLNGDVIEVSYDFEHGPVSTLSDADIAAVMSVLDDAKGDVAGLDADVQNLNVVELQGNTQYDTAAAEALYAFSRSSYAIIASGQSYVDALSAVGLAGALDCPILLTHRDYVPQATVDALTRLGVSTIIIVGGSAVISDAVESALWNLPAVTGVTRIFGQTQYDTQLKIFEYGEQRGLWNNSDTIVIASGSTIPGRFADSLSVSPAAYALKAPVFLVDDSGNLPDATAFALTYNHRFTKAVIVGGSVVVSDRVEGFMQAMTIVNGGSPRVERLAGASLYDTSAAVARWAVSNGILTWDGAAFATGKQPYDALAGSVVQGRGRSVLLLIDDSNYKTLSVLDASDAPLSIIKFFGGTAVVKQQTRFDVLAMLQNLGASVIYRDYDFTLDQLVAWEMEAWSAYDAKQYREALDPQAIPTSDSDFLQFAILSYGRSGLSVDQLNAYINDVLVRTNRTDSSLWNSGAYFIEAADTYGVNDVYLLAHAILESGWGTSDLSKGWKPDKDGVVIINNKTYEYHKNTTYYNFFGIGAVDSNALAGGRALAVMQGWTDVRKAILGGARWISVNYLNPQPLDESGLQNTLYKMRWDINRAQVTGGSVWHQYATGITWPTGIAALMDEIYDAAGVDARESGLFFEIPRYLPSQQESDKR